MLVTENDEIGLVDPSDIDLTELELHNARLVVCGLAEDVDEARELLTMLGLIP